MIQQSKILIMMAKMPRLSERSDLTYLIVPSTKSSNSFLQNLPFAWAFSRSNGKGVWSSFPGLDFEEDDEQLDDRNLEKLRHSRFIGFLEKCLEDFRVKNEKVLEKLSLCMRRYSPRDDTDIVDKFLNFAFDRSVKELDISLTSECGVERYRLAPQTFLNAKSIAALNLEHVTLYYQIGRPSPSNPFLKTLSLKWVHISKECPLSYIITACPSIEYLSLTSCYTGSIRVSSSSLKSLEVMHCWSERDEVGGLRQSIHSVREFFCLNAAT